jgi:hypothetical protein
VVLKVTTWLARKIFKACHLYLVKSLQRLIPNLPGISQEGGAGRSNMKITFFTLYFSRA